MVQRNMPQTIRPETRRPSRSIQWLCAALSLLPLWFSPAQATITDLPENKAARQQFLDAEQALKKGRMKTYQALKQQLQTYPLLPYLEYQEITRHLSRQDSQTIRTFINKYADTPLSSRLRNNWLDLLADKHRWKTYLDFAKPGGSIKRQCHRLWALIETGQQQYAFTQIEPVWLSSRSRPKACDPVFKAWNDAGELTDALVWQRIGLAMQARQIRLARYLKRFLPNSEGNWVSLWIDIHRHPQKLMQNQRLQQNHPMRDKILVHGVRRLARKDPEKAFEFWQSLQVRGQFTDAQKLTVGRTLAANLMDTSGETFSRIIEQVVPKHLRLDPRLSDKQFRQALESQDWERVLATIAGLSESDRAKERWRYWRARALLQLGQQEKGNQLLETLAKNRSYYGFMATNRLGTRFTMAHAAIDVTDEIVDRIASQPGMQRARELKILHRPIGARREWNWALSNRSTEELKGAARLAQQWDWPSQAIITLAKIRHWNDLELRFPLTHRTLIDRQAKSLDIDHAWIYAILRQESAFITDARSSAGAMGLMQLMPRTARDVATSTRHGPFKTRDLLKPGINIKLGTSYLESIYQKLQNNPVLATAAYNAGPWRVMKWLPKESQPTDVWIETVPFRETREYLKRVLAYTVIYSHRLGEDPLNLPEEWLKPIALPEPVEG